MAFVKVLKLKVFKKEMVQKFDIILQATFRLQNTLFVIF